jgi:ferredoxin-nitrite reductase
MRGLARIARELGDGDIRLTVWQNLILSGIARENAALVERCLGEISLTANATSVRAGLIACTGNTGCKFALSNTKDTAMAIADWVEPRVALDGPVNIHLTGCPNSCAQHYIGDIGMIACRIPIDEAGEDTVEGFHVFVGGGFGRDAGIGRELYRDVMKEDCPRLVERILAAYVHHRARAEETFLQFTRRHDVAELRNFVEAIAGEGTQ